MSEDHRGRPELIFLLGLQLLLLLGDGLIPIHVLHGELHQLFGRLFVPSLTRNNCESKKPRCLLVVAHGRPPLVRWRTTSRHYNWFLSADLSLAAADLDYGACISASIFRRLTDPACRNEETAAVTATGARYEIAIDGTPRTYRDREDLAREAAVLL